MTTQKNQNKCFEQVRQLYTEYTGQAITEAIKQVRADLTRQRDYVNSNESVQTFKYNHDIQEILDKLPVDQPAEVK